ncbi:hypothetical protein BT93_I0880 [Corymbia citriodora subsp. variegata]|nr:hypothetical protein BT93_I0880 [Corymbia citriodora subsp. variegata]
MHPNLTKALFLSYLLMVALSCKAAPGELNDTTTSPPCDGLGGTAECLIAYQQPELELVVGSNDYAYKALMIPPASCGKPPRSWIPSTMYHASGNYSNQEGYLNSHLADVGEDRNKSSS